MPFKKIMRSLKRAGSKILGGKSKGRIANLKDAPAQMIRRGMIAGPVAKDENPKMIPRGVTKAVKDAVAGSRKTTPLKSPFGRIARGIGSSMKTASQAVKKKKEEEEDKEPAAFKKGGMVKKGRGMGAATRGGGACAPRNPRKMMGGGMAKAYKKGGSACK